MTCLRSDRKCMAKAFGRSRSKLELMSYPSFKALGRSRSKLEQMSYPSLFLVLICGLKILRKGKQSSLRPFVLFFPFSLA